MLSLGFHSAVESITVLGRRGHCQAAFTMKELRELTKLDNASFLVYSEELEAGTTPASASEIKSTRVVKRLDGLLSTLLQLMHAAPLPGVTTPAP